MFSSLDAPDLGPVPQLRETSITGDRLNVSTIVVTHPDPRWEDPIFTGYLLKRGGRIKNWAQRYFILTRSGELWYFKNHESPEPCRPRPVVIRETKFYREKGMGSKRRFCIRISRIPNDFTVAAPTLEQQLEWIKYLGLSGGFHISWRNLIDDTSRAVTRALSKAVSARVRQMMTNRSIPAIGQADLSRWTPADVHEWLLCCGLFESTGERFSIYDRNFRDVSGAVIDEQILSESNLDEKLGISNPDHQRELMHAIRDLQTRRVFDYPTHVVSGKVDALLRRCGFLEEYQGANLRFIAKSLSDWECSMETYLDPSIMRDSFDQYLPNTGADDDDENEGEEDSDNDNVYATTDQPQENFRLPVKLLIWSASMARPGCAKFSKTVLNPAMTQLPIEQDLDSEDTPPVLRIAVIVGPFLLSWEEGSLVIPRKTFSVAETLLTYDVDTTTLLRNTTMAEVRMKLAEVVVRWNLEKTYVEESGSDPAKGNCQDFVEDVLNCLEVYIRKDGCFGEFIRGMKAHGRQDFVFRPSGLFVEHFRLKQREYSFQTHAELDSFVYDCAEIDELALQMDYKAEYKLLKSFDRVFWARHVTNRDIERFQASDRGCPFDPPRPPRRGPCFAGWATVQLLSGEKKVEEVCPGDVVLSGGGKLAVVRCVIKTVLPSGNESLVSIHSDERPWITKKHPIRMSSKWCYPFSVDGATLVTSVPCDAVYAFILEEDGPQSLIINGVECAGFAHNMTENDVIRHPYWGTNAIIRDLQEMIGWDDGYVVLTNGACVRNVVTGMVEKLVQEERSQTEDALTG